MATKLHRRHQDHHLHHSSPRRSIELRSKVVEIEERRRVAHVWWIISRLLVFISQIVELAIGILAFLLSSVLLLSGLGQSCTHQPMIHLCKYH